MLVTDFSPLKSVFLRSDFVTVLLLFLLFFLMDIFKTADSNQPHSLLYHGAQSSQFQMGAQGDFEQDEVMEGDFTYC